MLQANGCKLAALFICQCLIASSPATVWRFPDRFRIPSNERGRGTTATGHLTWPSPVRRRSVTHASEDDDEDEDEDDHDDDQDDDHDDDHDDNDNDDDGVPNPRLPTTVLVW